MSEEILRVADCDLSHIRSLLGRFKLQLHLTQDNNDIPGSYWGDSEAGLVSNKVYVRQDTPIHSLLHETCHYICMDDKRRRELDTNAEGDYDEENGVCYLQILLADDIPEMGRKRMMLDMDRWGYTFRLGSAENWFINDSADTLDWLTEYKLLATPYEPNYTLRA